ncbi:hypothetical protein NA57DRAFT_48745 [Rhizodiscina lignyota]|uniref:Peroxisomal membrane protein PEX14 n=1 Tax=Rhizodiscina lignyota TaxID=1504668 RepID=A0A9P4M3G6_9PEZI|nr:hypothetical protein NA57DRAFT_48745 [Rhizodiscina lignyota]
MSDNSNPPKPSKASIPSWQRVHTPKPSDADQSPKEETPPPPESTVEEKEGPESEVDLSEQATRFLEDPSIKDAPRERKVAFLESKGVGKDEIERSLPEQTQIQAPRQTEAEPKVVHSSSSTEKKDVQPRTQARPQSSRKDVPPIITYPEFMLQSTKPPPLVTTQRLLGIAYVTGGLAATMYGLSKYIVEPMSETLAAARHEFLTHSTTHIDELNSRLEKAVSELPPTDSKRNSRVLIPDQDLEPPSPTDSDPTELFHRDIGTQTSPNLSRQDSKTSLSSSDANADITNYHESRIKSLTSHMSDLRSSSEAHQTVATDLTSTLGDLTSYLTEMSYSSPYYSYGYGGLDGRSDAIDALKAEIRGVKGVLLSARNFPASRPMGVR